MRIVRLNDAGDAERWDRYVEPRTSTVTDLFAWRQVVQEAYGIRAHYFGVSRGSELDGVLGLFEIRHPLLGHYLATAPFANDGGLLVDGGEALELLSGEARRLADQLDVDYLAIRTRDVAIGDYLHDKRYHTAVIDLSAGAESVWKHTLPAKTRNQVRRGRKEGS